MFTPFIMQGRVDSPTSPLSSSSTLLAGLHTSSDIHSRSTDRIPLYISTSDTPLLQWHARSPRLPEPAPVANASADTSHRMDSPVCFTDCAAIRNTCPARFFVFKVLFFNTWPPEFSRLGASPSHEQNASRSETSLRHCSPLPSSPSAPATHQIHPPRSNPLR